MSWLASTMSLDSGAHYTFMMVNYWTFTIQMKFHEEGILKKMKGETLCVHPRSLASLHLSSSPSLSSPTLFFFCLSHTLSLHPCSALTYHISAPCGPTGHHIRVCIHPHAALSLAFKKVCCFLAYLQVSPHVNIHWKKWRDADRFAGGRKDVWS